jgi:hypothetical protein
VGVSSRLTFIDKTMAQSAFGLGQPPDHLGRQLTLVVVPFIAQRLAQHVHLHG